MASTSQALPPTQPSPSTPKDACVTLPFSGSCTLLWASQCCSGALSLDPCFGLGLPVAGVWAQRRWEYGETSGRELDAGG